jgi:hypothetical protein
MASILPKQPMDESSLNLLLSYLTQQLPQYAIPHFIRLALTPHETTSTLKIRKAQLAAEGFQAIDRCPHFVLSQGQYLCLTRDRLSELESDHLPLGF